MPTGTEMAFAGVVGDQAALQAVGGAQRDGAHDAVAELLLHFQRDRGVLRPSARRTPSARLAREFDVDDGADDLDDLALVLMSTPRTLDLLS